MRVTPFLFLSAAAIWSATGSAVAAGSIATATAVKTSAVGEVAGQEHTLKVGGEFVEDEVVKTDRDGNVHLKFIDDTLLTVGPASTIKLDKFTFDPDHKASKFVLDTTRGAFRFATGHSEHRAYEIVTPVAVIGVRGTQFAFGVERTRLTIVVTDGTVTSCTRAASPRCVSAAAGNTIVATPSGAVVRRTLGAIPAMLRTVLVLPATRVPTRAVRNTTPVKSGSASTQQGGVIGPGLLEQGQGLTPQGPAPTGTPIAPPRGGSGGLR